MIRARPTLVFAVSLALSTGAAAQDAAGDADFATTLASRGCVGCHSLDGSARQGPSFAHLDGRERSVRGPDGATRTLIADEAYVVRSILEPDADVVEGFPSGQMPRLADPDEAARLARAVLAASRAAPDAPPAPRAPFWVALAALAFAALHFLLSSSRVRGAGSAALGEARYLALYTLVILASFVWLVGEWTYAPFVELFAPPAWTRWIPNVVMPVSYVLLVGGYTIKSPTMAGMASAADAGATGFLRITRHPALWGFALWALAHLPANGDLRSLALFGSIAGLALGGMLHIDARRRASGGEAWARFEAATSVVPFAAVASGRQRWPSWSELGWWRIVLGIAGWALMLHLHRMVLGVSPLP